MIAQCGGQIRRLPPVLALVLVTVAINAPFFNQAFHMDDGLFLLLARNVRNHPWFPQDQPVLFEGLFGTDLASTEHAWPITAYLMALCARIGGFSELCIHVGFLVFPIIMAVSIHSIARRVTRHPVLASLTLVCMPAVYVNSHTLMADIPQLSLWLAALALLSHGIHSGKMNWVWVAAAVSAVALLLSYSGCCLILLMAFYAALRRNCRAAVIALAVPASAFSIWLAINSFHYHRVTPVMIITGYLFAKRVLAPELVVQKTVSAILTLGGVTMFPLLFLVLARKGALAAGIFATCISCFFLVASMPGLLQGVMLAVFLAAGCAAVLESGCVTITALASIRKNRRQAVEDLLLGTWFFGMLFFSLVVYMTGSARYLLPALPPLLLIMFRRLESRAGEKKAFGVAAANLVLSGALAVSLAIADYKFAGIYREFASSMKISSNGTETRLWFTGEWGLRTYLEQLGGQELGRRDARPRPGDLLVVPSLATPYKTLFSETLALDSIVMLAPSGVTFDVPRLPEGCVLVYTIGMPFYDKSDGLDFIVRFQSESGSRILHHERLLPAAGRQWRVHEIPLPAAEAGAVVFTADVGDTGNAEADWLALARARICRRDAQGETVLYDFRAHLKTARIDSVPGIQYHTEGNQPVLAMTTWLEQEPATILQGRYEFDPAFPLRLLDERSHAGFWGSSWGLLPFSIRLPGSSLESISVYEITRLVDAYGEATPSWYSVSP
jgi:hypothetical protein